MNSQPFNIVGYKIVSPLHLAALLAYTDQLPPPVRLKVVTSKGPWASTIIQALGEKPANIDIEYAMEDESEQAPSRLWPLYLLLKPLVLLANRLLRRETTPICSPTMTSLMYCARSWHHLQRFRPVVLDEGIGSYNMDYSLRRAAEQASSNPLLRSAMFQLYRLLWRNLGFFGGERISLFQFESGTPSVNRTVAESYQAVFAAAYQLRQTPVVFQPRTVLILTQPFSEAGICSEQEMIASTELLVSEARRNGLHALIKMHPAERPGKYAALNTPCLDYPGPVEEIFSAADKNLYGIWGFESTSLIIGGALYGLSARTYRTSLSAPLLDALEKEAYRLFQTYTEIVEAGATN